MFGKLLKKKDIVEESRDHNPGTANAFLYGGFLCGLLTLCADMAKGFLPVFLYLRRVAEPDIAGLALVLAFTFIFFSVVLRIRPHYYWTILTYLAALILMLVFCRVRPVKIGFGLIVLSVMIRMATSREEKGAFEVKLLWRRCFCPEGASARDRFKYLQKHPDTTLITICSAKIYCSFIISRLLTAELDQTLRNLGVC